MRFMYFISVNQNGETAFDIARRLKNAQCEELVSVIILYTVLIFLCCRHC